MKQTHPLPSSDKLKELYAKYYNFGGEKGTIYTKLRELLFSSKFYRFWLAIDGDVSFHSKKGSGLLLDVGCNEGRGLTIYRQIGFDAEGLELNETAAAEARAKGFNVYIGSLDNHQPQKLYDVGVLSNVLEHSIDPNTMLCNVRRVLKSGGQVWISCPNSKSWLRSLFGKLWINWHVPFHIVHFSDKTINRLLNNVGFEVVSTKQITPSLWVAHSIITSLYAKSGVPTKQLRNPILVAILVVLIRGILFPFLWLGNKLGRGDCLVLVAKILK